jgi:hypothetical protein
LSNAAPIPPFALNLYNNKTVDLTSFLSSYRRPELKIIRSAVLTYVYKKVSGGIQIAGVASHLLSKYLILYY